MSANDTKLLLDAINATREDVREINTRLDNMAATCRGCHERVAKVETRVGACERGGAAQERRVWAMARGVGALIVTLGGWVVALWPKK